MPQIIPLTAVPAQNLTANLGGQTANIAVYQKGAYLYFDLTMGNPPVPIVTARICQISEPEILIRLLGDAQYLGFVGDFCWVDLYASPSVPRVPPSYSGLGSRFQLVYLSAADVAAL